MKKVPVHILSNLTEEDEIRIIMKDNGSHGEFDWDVFHANDWGQFHEPTWGVELPGFDVAEELEAGDIVELDKITTTFNINIKCDSPEELEELKFKLGITSNSIHKSMLETLLA